MLGKACLETMRISGHPMAAKMFWFRVGTALDALHSGGVFRAELYGTLSGRLGSKVTERKTERRNGSALLEKNSFRAELNSTLKGKLGSKATKRKTGSSSLEKQNRGFRVSKVLKSEDTPLVYTGSKLPKNMKRDSSSYLKDNISRLKTSFGNCKQKQSRKTVMLDPSVDIAEKHKKGKRIMQLDPKDSTSKRFQDQNQIQMQEAREKSKEDLDISMNARFRAIQPSPTLLLHIDRYLLGRRRLSEWQKEGYNVKLTAPLDNAPYIKDVERQPIQEEVDVASSFVPVDLPEVAFAGRSNVGKSSLINALTRQWGVARTSDKPGLTQTINFFRLGGRLCLVDLPGYGFAYAKEEKKEAWHELVKEYVSSRESLKRVCLLIDAKWGMKPGDKELISLMESAGTKYQIVLTKTDTVFPIDLARRATEIQEVVEKNKLLISPLMMVSSKTGGGLGLLRSSLARIAKRVLA